MKKGPPKLPTPTPVPMHGSGPMWHHMLRTCGYPTSVVVLDWETYFDSEYHMGIDGKALSTIEYVMDERYEEMGVAALEITQPCEPPAAAFWAGGDRAAMYMRHLQNRYGSDLAGATIVAQNAAFDGTILARKYGIVPPHFIDLLALARHEESRTKNGLEFLARRFGLPAKGDTSQFLGVHLTAKYACGGGPPRLLHPGITREQESALATYACHDAWLEWQAFIRLLPRLSNPHIELRLIQHTLELFLKPTLAVDYAYTQDLVAQMEKRKDDVVLLARDAMATVKGCETLAGLSLTEVAKQVSGTISFRKMLGSALDAAGDRLDGYQKIGKPKKDGTEVKLLAIAKDDPQLERLTSHPDSRVRALIAARTAIKSWPLHISRVTGIVRQSKAAGGLMPVALRYCGAHTGRWAGGEKVNLQNLPSRSPEPLVNKIRGALVAPPGCKLVVVDASQIEARVCDWIAGEPLDVWRDSSRDPYCEFAGKIVNRVLRKPRKTDPEPLKKYLTKMRGMGKVGTLGCGYGMGADKALSYAENSYGVIMTPAEGVQLVKTYRATHAHVCRFWRVIEQRFKAAARYRESGQMDRGLRFHHEETGDITVITLPNGRTLKYHGARVSIINGREQVWMPDRMEPGKRVFLWGGTLTENVVQAMSRDILAEAILNTETAGHHVALHVHDEEVAVTSEVVAADALAEIIQIMSTPPSWAKDCPLGAEGKVTDRYEK